MIKRKTLLLATALIAWAALAVADSPADRDQALTPPPSGTYEGLVRPCKKIQLALRVSGVIATRPVAEGERVKAGQVIAELRSDVEKAALQLTRLKAESEHEYQAAVMQERQALVELGRVNDLFKRNMATKWEQQEAQVKADIARVRTEYAQFQRTLNAQELVRDTASVAERRLVAPFDGIVSKMPKEAGEAVQELTPIAELVQLDTLWIELNMSADQFHKVRVGQAATVTVGDGEAARSRQARVIMVDPLVDAASATFRVRLELANPDSAFTAGLRAHVKFLATAAAEPAVSTAPEK